MSESVVYCPPLVPKGPTISQNRSSRGRVSVSARGSAYELNFVSSSAQRADPRSPDRLLHLGHWLVGATTPAGLSRHDPLGKETFFKLVRGRGAKIVKRTEIDGVPVTVVNRKEDSASLHAGHVVAVWRLGGRVLAVSLHGWERRATVLDMARALIRETRSCPPRSPEGNRCQLVIAAHR